MNKCINILGIIMLLTVSAGCKEQLDGGADPFQWRVESVANPSHTQINIDKQGDVKIYLTTNKEKIVLAVLNYFPWDVYVIKEGNQTEEDGRNEYGKEIIRDWGTAKLEQNILTIDISNLPPECTEYPIKLGLSHGDAHSHVEIYKRDA